MKKAVPHHFPDNALRERNTSARPLANVCLSPGIAMGEKIVMMGQMNQNHVYLRHVGSLTTNVVLENVYRVVGCVMGMTTATTHQMKHNALPPLPLLLHPLVDGTNGSAPVLIETAYTNMSYVMEEVTVQVLLMKAISAQSMNVPNMDAVTFAPIFLPVQFVLAGAPDFS